MQIIIIVYSVVTVITEFLNDQYTVYKQMACTALV